MIFNMVVSQELDFIQKTIEMYVEFQEKGFNNNQIACFLCPACIKFYDFEEMEASEVRKFCKIYSEWCEKHDMIDCSDPDLP